MPLFRVAHNYRSSLGQFVEGDQVELDDELAAYINRDSPGTLTGSEASAEWTGKSPTDRMVRSAQRRQDREGDPGDQGPITRDDHKATRNKGD